MPSLWTTLWLPPPPLPPPPIEEPTLKPPPPSGAAASSGAASGAVAGGAGSGASFSSAGSSAVGVFEVDQAVAVVVDSVRAGRQRSAGRGERRERRDGRRGAFGAGRQVGAGQAHAQCGRERKAGHGNGQCELVSHPGGPCRQVQATRLHGGPQRNPAAPNKALIMVVARHGDAGGFQPARMCSLSCARCPRNTTPRTAFGTTTRTACGRAASRRSASSPRRCSTARCWRTPWPPLSAPARRRRRPSRRRWRRSICPRRATSNGSKGAFARSLGRIEDLEDQIDRISREVGQLRRKA